MPSYSPEAVALKNRPTFNNRASSVYASGDPTPPGLTAVDTKTTVTLLNQNPVATLTITNAGSALSNGTPTGVATTATKGAGTGLTVNLTVSGGSVTVATVNAGGDGYSVGDTVSVTGYAGVVLTVAS